MERLPLYSSAMLGAEYSACGRDTGCIKEAALTGKFTIELWTGLTERGSILKPQLGDEHA